MAVTESGPISSRRAEKYKEGIFLSGSVKHVDLLKGVSLLTNATIRIQRDRTYYFDPYRVEGHGGDADFIFVSHSHGDHFSPEDIRRLAGRATTLIAPESCAGALKDAGFDKAFTVRPLESYEVNGQRFSTVPMYNIGKRFHTRESNWVGYVVYIDGAAYYFAGDTDAIPEMKDIAADVAFLPVGGTYTMNAKEAAEAAGMIRPKVAVPMHYADVAGSFEDGDIFIRELDKSITGVLLK